jgi:hypothetical protein
MIKKNNETSTLMIYFSIIALGFLLFLGGIYLLCYFLNLSGHPTDFWVCTAALASGITAAAVLGAGFMAYKELKEISSTRYLEVADKLFNELNSQENIDSRQWIFQNLSKDPKEGIKTLSQEGRKAIKQTLNSLDRVAFMSQAGWIPDEIIMPWMHPMIVKSWEKLESYVIYERERRSEPYYYQNIDLLVARCLAWRQKNHIELKTKWIDDAI